MKFFDSDGLADLSRALSGEIDRQKLQCTIESFSVKDTSADKKKYGLLKVKLGNQVAQQTNSLLHTAVSSSGSESETNEPISEPISEPADKSIAYQSHHRKLATPSSSYGGEKAWIGPHGTSSTNRRRSHSHTKPSKHQHTPRKRPQLVAIGPNHHHQQQQQQQQQQQHEHCLGGFRNSNSNSKADSMSKIENTASLRVLYYLMQVLNMVNPDYEFTTASPESFRREPSVDAAKFFINRTLSDFYMKSSSFYYAQHRIWAVIGREIELGDCQVFSYVPQIESDPYAEAGTLWAFNYFFFNAKQRRVLFFSCRAEVVMPAMSEIEQHASDDRLFPLDECL